MKQTVLSHVKYQSLWNEWCGFGTCGGNLTSGIEHMTKGIVQECTERTGNVWNDFKTGVLTEKLVCYPSLSHLFFLILF